MHPPSVQKLPTITAHPAEIVGRAFRALRELQKVSLSQIAAEMGMSVSGWSRVETGDTAMTTNQLWKASEAIRVSPVQVIENAQALANSIRKPEGTTR